jgi:hypothetical protein
MKATQILLHGSMMSVVSYCIVTINRVNAVSCSLFPQGMRSALSLRDDFADSETFHQSLEALLTWVCEIEELTANQKPQSSEVKVVKAQLQEQKVQYQSKVWTHLL